MDLRMVEVCERECAVAALAGRQICPDYHLPCWLCIVLHLLTGTVRSVTDGRFDRFMGARVVLWNDGKILTWPSLICPHHPYAMTDEYKRRHGRSYWHHADPSLTTTPVTPARKVSDASQTQTTEEPSFWLPAL